MTFNNTAINQLTPCKQRITAFYSKALREHCLFLLLSALYISLSLLLQWHFQTSLQHNTPIFLLFIDNMVMCSVGLFSAYTCWRALMLSYQHRKLAFAELWAELTSGLLAPYNLGCFVLTMSVFPLIAYAQMGLKILIPHVNAYQWDTLFIRLDQLFGITPWRLLQAGFGSPHRTLLLDRIYMLWFATTLCFYIWQAASPRRQLRMQYLLCFLLTWMVLGGLAASGFASVGPCFVELLTGQHYPDFAAMLQHLHKISTIHHIYAVDGQYWLWQQYQQHTHPPGSGISAMPSLHVAIAVLSAHCASHYHRGLGILFTLYSIIIFIGSIYLGWHYAVDGIAAAIGTSLLWKLAGTLSAKSITQK